MHMLQPQCHVCLNLDLTVFGVTLDVAIQRSLLATDGIELPTVFRLCIDYLEENGELNFFTKVKAHP